jgi:GDP-4-dehydro-6-deoxy-D-mannose reductase
VLIAQSWASLYNMNIVIAKPSNLIGPGLSNGVCSIFARKIVDMEKTKSENVLRVNNLYAKRDFIDVRDAVNAYETLLLKGKSGEVYDIASGINRSLEEVIHVMKSLTEVDFQVKSQTNNQIEEPNENLLNKISALNWKSTIPFKSSINDILTYYREND